MNTKEYTDIHSHILMGVDDGAEDLDEAVKMLKLANQEGITNIILTPHYRDIRRSEDRVRISQKLHVLQEEAERENIPVRLFTGNELYYSSELIRYLEEGSAVTLAGSDRYLLVEFNPLEGILYLRNGLNDLVCNGYQPILAHAERYEALFERENVIGMLRNSGILIQINVSSIMGKTGLQYKKRARKLLKEKLVDFVATDAHDCGKRAPLMQECGSYISRKYGEEYYNRIFYQNPSAVLNNKEI